MSMRLFYFILFFTLISHVSAQTLVVGINENEPLKTYDSIQGKASGIFIDLLEYIAQEEGWNLIYKPLTFHESLIALEQGTIDIMPDLGYSDSRNNIYNFSEQDVMLSWGQVYARKETNIKSLIDLENKKIAIVKNNVFDDGFIQLASNFNLNCEYVYVENYSDVFQLIESNQVDAGVVNRIFGDYNNVHYNVFKTSIIFSPVHLHYAFPKDNKYTEIRSTIDDYLIKFKEENNSIYYQLIEDYFNVKEINVIPDIYKVLALLFVLLLLITVLFIFILRYTVKKRTNELNSALKKAKESDHLKSVFLRNLSHEIRTPMNGINGFSLLLKDDQLDSSSRNRYVDLVISSSQQLLSIVDNILSVSLLETGQDKPKISKVNINELLDDLYLMFSKSLDEKNIKFELIKSVDDESVTIQTDRTKIRQVLSNILGNAVKFTTSGSIKYGYVLKDKFIEFFIEDTGIGIDMKLKEQIYKLFSQEDNSSKRRYDGAGLGLSIAKGYVELLGGKIYFESKKGKGTTFYFTIPYSK